MKSFLMFISLFLLACAGSTHAVEVGNNKMPAYDSTKGGGAPFTDPATEMAFVLVKGGCYLMGDTFGDGDKDEKPPHEVCVNDFKLAKNVVTKGEFKKFADESGYRTEAEKGDGCYTWNGSTWKMDSHTNWRNPGFPQEDSHPAVCVSWNDAIAFTDWMSRKSGIRYRLPTEAEWEFAARSGGKKEKFAGFSEEGQLYQYANFCDSNCDAQWKTVSQNDGYKYTSPVGSYKPNGLELYDMSGNVWQWVSDRYGENYYQESTKIYPPGPSTGPFRVLRGGSWNFRPHHVRTTWRWWHFPVDRYGVTGFRPAISVQ